MLHKIMQNKYGFTAAEIVTVVAIIAILALIVIPRFFQRTDEAKIVAAKDEMQQIAKMESLAYADTGFYIFPPDLMRVPQSAYATVTVWSFDTWTINVPGAVAYSNYSAGYFDFVNFVPERAVTVQLGNQWQGPYLQYQKFDTTLNLPLDPWGKPYYIYGPVFVSDPRLTASPDRTNSMTGAIWSGGPNYKFDSDTATMPWGPALGDDIILKF